MPVPASNITPSKRAATCNGHMQWPHAQQLKLVGFFLFFFAHLTLFPLFCLWATPCPLHLFFFSRGSAELAAARFLQSREPEVTCNYELQVQLLPSFYWMEWMKQMKQLTTICSFLIHLNTLPSPLNFPTALLEDKTHLDKCKPEAVFLSVHTALQGGRANPILHQPGASRFCPSDLLQKHSVPLA